MTYIICYYLPILPHDIIKNHPPQKRYPFLSTKSDINTCAFVRFDDQKTFETTFEISSRTFDNRVLPAY